MSQTIGEHKHSIDVMFMVNEAIWDRALRKFESEGWSSHRVAFFEGVKAGNAIAMFKLNYGTVVTSHINPPIPVHSQDWIAYIDGREEDQEYGTGATEREAIIDFVNKYVKE